MKGASETKAKGVPMFLGFFSKDTDATKVVRQQQDEKFNVGSQLVPPMMLDFLFLSEIWIVLTFNFAEQEESVESPQDKHYFTKRGYIYFQSGTNSLSTPPFPDLGASSLKKCLCISICTTLIPVSGLMFCIKRCIEYTCWNGRYAAFLRIRYRAFQIGSLYSF